MVARLNAYPSDDAPDDYEAWLALIRRALELGAQVRVRMAFPTGVQVQVHLPAPAERSDYPH